MPARYAVRRFLRDALEGYECNDLEFALANIENSTYQIHRIITEHGLNERLHPVLQVATWPRMIAELSSEDRQTLIAHAQTWWSLDLKPALRIFCATEESLERVFGARSRTQAEDKLFLNKPTFEVVMRMKQHLKLDLGRVFNGAPL